MRFTRYDRVSSFMIALFLGLAITVFLVVAQWLTIRREPPPTELVPLDMSGLSADFEDIGGGFEDGRLEDTEFIDSPLDGDPNAAPGWAQGDQLEVAQTLTNVVEVSARATQQVQQGMALVPTGRPDGTGGGGRGSRPLGSGPGTKGGVAAYLRWHIRFDESSVTEYARQLDYFHIELGVYDPASGRVTYVSGLSTAAPRVRTVDKWDDDRVYFKWTGEGRSQVDRDLLAKAKVDASKGEILHFYPDQTANMLVQIEVAYAKRNLKEIRRTYFVVVAREGGYAFEVTRQTYLQ